MMGASAKNYCSRTLGVLYFNYFEIQEYLVFFFCYFLKYENMPYVLEFQKMPKRVQFLFFFGVKTGFENTSPVL